LSQEKVASFRGKIDKETKVLKINDRDSMDRFLETLEGLVEITIREVSSRTNHQNRYYWGPVMDTLINSGHFEGYFKNDMHDALKGHFNIESTKTLTTQSFQEYLNEITIWAATEYGIDIPPPSEDFFI
tara:strand:+ start:38543 stop:38929 length:387 start_codon:yes stop_codon:yes gene_type:complete